MTASANDENIIYCLERLGEKPHDRVVSYLVASISSVLDSMMTAVDDTQHLPYTLCYNSKFKLRLWLIC